MLAVAEGAASPLARWESFYVIVGSSAAALTGLQFVVIVRRDAAPALFAIGGAALLLLFIGIHNAWDAVTYVAIDRPENAKASKDQR